MWAIPRKLIKFENVYNNVEHPVHFKYRGKTGPTVEHHFNNRTLRLTSVDKKNKK